VGFVELSLTYRVPVVPTAVIGGEEQYPMVLDIKPVARTLGFPYFPLTFFWPWLGPFPVPTKYYLYYGKPFHFYRKYPPSTVRNPETVRKLAHQVRERVKGMIREGLEKRKGLF